MAENQKTISWRAPEFRHYEKNPGWYIAASAVAVLIIAFFVLQNDLFAAITSGILALIVIFFSRHQPKVVDIELNSKGVSFGSLFYPYKQLKYFWIVDNERHKTVNFHTTTLVNNVFILELDRQNPDHVRDFLKTYLLEHHETDETVIQKIMHALKF